MLKYLVILKKSLKEIDNNKDLSSMTDVKLLDYLKGMFHRFEGAGICFQLVSHNILAKKLYSILYDRQDRHVNIKNVSQFAIFIRSFYGFFLLIRRDFTKIYISHWRESAGNCIYKDKLSLPGDIQVCYVSYRKDKKVQPSLDFIKVLGRITSFLISIFFPNKHWRIIFSNFGSFTVQYFLYYLFFSIKKCDLILSTVYWENLPLVAFAMKSNISYSEVQHCYISDYHFYYDSYFYKRFNLTLLGSNSLFINDWSMGNRSKKNEYVLLLMQPGYEVFFDNVYFYLSEIYDSDILIRLHPTMDNKDYIGYKLSSQSKLSDDVLNCSAVFGFPSSSLVEVSKNHSNVYCFNVGKVLSYNEALVKYNCNMVNFDE